MRRMRAKLAKVMRPLLEGRLVDPVIQATAFHFNPSAAHFRAAGNRLDRPVCASARGGVRGMGLGRLGQEANCPWKTTVVGDSFTLLAMQASSAARVFISYAHNDGSQLAKRLRNDIDREGYDVWVDSSRLNGGASWTSEIELALDKSDVVLALLSRGSFISDICRAEQLRSLRK